MSKGLWPCCRLRSFLEKKYHVVLFDFLAGISFLVVIFSFRVELFVLVYFFVRLFNHPPPTTKIAAAAAASLQIPILIPAIPLLKNDGRIFPSCIFRNPLHLLLGKNILPPRRGSTVRIRFLFTPLPPLIVHHPRRCPRHLHCLHFCFSVVVLFLPSPPLPPLPHSSCLSLRRTNSKSSIIS